MSQSSQISKLFGVFAGAEGWILGKGPSLDLFNGEYNEVAIAINDTPCKCDIRIYVDPINRIIDDADIVAPWAG